MVLELHIWGPAFGLPSLDPECLAAVAYFTQAVPPGRWVLLAAHDEGMSEISSFSTLLTAHALPLLDLSLYVSTQNYNATTRPAYSSLLSFPATWIIPTKRRYAAKVRSAHLGLFSLDLDSTAPDAAKPTPATALPAAVTEAIPASLRRPNKSVSAAIRNYETASRIRLEALMERVLGPLSALLRSTSTTSPAHENKGGPFLLSPIRPSTLDCLALGHLALFLLPDVPLPFLSTTLKEKYPALTDYVRRNVKRLYGGTVWPEDARLGQTIRSRAGGDAKAATTGEDDDDDDNNDPATALHHDTNMPIGSTDLPVVLPWRTPTPPSPLSTARLLLRETMDAVPVLGALTKPDPVLRDGSLARGVGVAGTGSLPLVASLGLGVAALAGALVWSGGLGLGGEGAGGERVRDLGETGALLGLGRRRGNNVGVPGGEGGVEGGVGAGVGVEVAVDA